MRLKGINLIICAAALAASGCGAAPKGDSAPAAAGQVPWLCVEGTQLMNEYGDTVALAGVSFGWHQMWPRFYNDSTVDYLVNDWGAQVIRASMGVDHDSDCYVSRPGHGIECITTVVDAAIAAGVYVIIDWHSHNLLLEPARDFFVQMATRYKGVPNVIYELYNEPVDDPWEALKAYAEDITAAIRAIEPRALILMGCPHWDQDINLIAKDQITAYGNLMYTVHFYAATHTQWLRDRTDQAIAAGVPVFISECAAMEASGDGPIDPIEWQRWLEWMRSNHLSWAMWSISDKDETCSMLYPSAASTGYWADDDMKEWGHIVRGVLKSGM